MRPSSPSEATLPRGCAAHPTGPASGGPGNVRCSSDQPARPSRHRHCGSASSRPSRGAPRPATTARGSSSPRCSPTGLVAAGHDVTLFATADSITTARLRSTSPRGWNEDDTIEPKVAEALHIAAAFEHAADLDIIHNGFDFLPLTYSALVDTPVVTTIHGFSSPRILPVYERYDATTAYVAISDADRHPALHYAATIHHGIDTDAFAVDPAPRRPPAVLRPDPPGQGHRRRDRRRRAEPAGGSSSPGSSTTSATSTSRSRPTSTATGSATSARSAAADRAAVLGAAHALLHLIDFDEPFGYSVVEAMACGTPVIAHRRGSMPELITDGVTGFLVDGTDERRPSGRRRRLARSSRDPGRHRRPLRPDHDGRALRRRLPLPARRRSDRTGSRHGAGDVRRRRPRPSSRCGWRRSADNAPSSP